MQYITAFIGKILKVQHWLWQHSKGQMSPHNNNFKSTEKQYHCNHFQNYFFPPGWWTKTILLWNTQFWSKIRSTQFKTHRQR